MTGRNRRAFRVVTGFWLAGWFINAAGNPGFLRNFRDALRVPLAHEAFPALLTDARVAFAIYLAPLLVLPALWSTERLARFAAALMTAASLLALWHLETASDATFVTSFWVSLWLLWFVHRAQRTDEGFVVMATGLAHAVVGLAFLGALVGKLTPGYWNGQAFYGLYFQHERGWPYPLLRENLSPGSLRALATWFSRVAMLMEGALTLSPLLPTRLVLGLYVGTMLTMMVARNYHLFSVLGCLLGLLIATLLLAGGRGHAASRPRAAAHRASSL